MEYRRFGKTEIKIPVVSSGGMRFQGGWKSDDPYSEECQRNLEACVHKAVELGINHFETARGYGTSEEQLGHILPKLPRDEIIVQTKVTPFPDPAQFVETFEKSMGLLKLDYVDLFAFHGINNTECLENAKRCYDTAAQWRKEGRVRHIGFSTHAETPDLVAAVETGLFEYVNLHWYYIFQENWPAVEAATRHDMGVFIISPNDKGGMLYKPAGKLVDLCAPLDPMVFNGLFCLARPEVHTLSCGIAKPSDFEIHALMAAQLGEAAEIAGPVAARLDAAFAEALGADWAARWREGLPRWHEAPGGVNIPIILHLRNLALAFDMVDYGKMRYGLLGKGGHWFPGNNAENVAELDLTDCLRDSPFAQEIPGLLAEAHEMLGGEERKRLQEE